MEILYSSKTLLKMNGRGMYALTDKRWTVRATIHAKHVCFFLFLLQLCFLFLVGGLAQKKLSAKRVMTYIRRLF